jgi:DNA-binding transcriptional LysR family regulator
VHEVIPPRSTGGWRILIAKLNANRTNRLELHKQSELLRHGLVDLETGEEGDLNGLEVRTRGLFRDHFIGVARANHALNQGGSHRSAMPLVNIFSFHDGEPRRGRR